jgi:hypothetical protein
MMVLGLVSGRLFRPESAESVPESIAAPVSS